MRSKTFYRMLAVPVSLLAAAAVAGCAPDAASDNVRWSEDPFSPSLAMEGRTADAAVGAMRGPAAGVPTRRLVAASAPRWGDVPMAIRNVAGVSFIGIDRVDADDRTCVASTVRPDGQHGTVTVRRLADGSLECSAQLGFSPGPEDGRFVRDLERELRRLAAIKRPQ
jgi:hypothetical protein